MDVLDELYEGLSKPFDVTFSDVRGGVSLTYITGEQVISRLNEVLGVAGWTFRVIEHGIHAEADEAWALGELTARISDGNEYVSIVKQQFGSQKLKRSRSTGAPLDLGYDLKGAGTDAMKKCASLLGVGLYLSRKKPQQAQRRNQSSTEARQSTADAEAEARKTWASVCEKAKQKGIEVKTLSDTVSVSQIERWTELLQNKIDEQSAA